MNHSKIEISNYNPLWPSFFEEEAQKLKQILKSHCLDIHHIGSTSVPGLSAKPIIDIILVAKDPDACIPLLEKENYIYKGEYNLPFRYFLRKKTDRLNIHLHLYQEGNPEIDLHLKFRDYLRAHPDSLQDYADLKMQLIKDERSHENEGNFFKGYNLGKDAFIRKILQKSGFKGLCMRLSAHHYEIVKIKYFRQVYFFDKFPMPDPYLCTLNQKDHLHLVFYKGVEIIGYAHVQLWPENRAALRIIAIEENYQNLGYGHKFMRLIEKWLHKNNIDSLHIKSSPQAYGFYVKLGYTNMPFSDPDNYPHHLNDIEIAKRFSIL